MLSEQEPIFIGNHSYISKRLQLPFEPKPSKGDLFIRSEAYHHLWLMCKLDRYDSLSSPQ